MAGIKGQPSPKPSNVPNPVPNEADIEDFERLMAEIPDDIVLQNEGELQLNSEPEETIENDFPGRGVVESVAENLPAIGGIVGAVAGTAAGPAGTVGGAALGASAGTAYRQIIERDLLGKSDAPRS